MTGASALCLSLSLIASAAAAAVLGSGLCRKKEESLKKVKNPRLSVVEAAENPVLLFVTLSAIGCVAGVAFTPWAILPVVLVSVFAARGAPKRAARKRRQERREACERHLDMMCDIVAMGVDAGLSFDSALELYCGRFDNELAKEMELASRQWSHGLVGRKEALDSLASEIGSPLFKRFSDTVVHAVSQGAPLAGMLRKYAIELRRRRRVLVERKVEQAPIKMLVPTGVCILPAMLLLVIGPMLLQFLET